MYLKNDLLNWIIIQFNYILKINKFNLFDAFSHETKESGRNKRYCALRTEILSVKVYDH